MDTLYLLQYNNYFNRIVKGYPTIAEYSSFVLVHAPENNPIANISFNPNDGVNTEQIVNWNGAMPDYVLVDHGDDTFTRWYVIGHERTRANQYRLFLRRDLVMDYYSAIMTAPCFVEKATLPSNNNLIFNSEQMTFNQIKTSETLLMDETQCPWITIYASRYTHDNTAGTPTPTTFEVDINTVYPYKDITYAEYQEILNNAVHGVFGYLDEVTLYITEGAAAGTARRAYIMTENDLLPQYLTIGPTSENPFVSNAANILENFQLHTLGSVLNVGPAYVDNYDETLYDQILQLTDQFIRVQMPDGSYSFFKIGNSGVQTWVAQIGQVAGNLLELLSPIRQAFKYPNNVTFGNPDIYTSTNVMIAYTGRLVRYTITEVQAPQAVGETLTIQADRYHLTDAPYDMFVIPFSSKLEIINSKIAGWTKVKSDRYRALQTAGELLSKYSGINQIIDAQILPYCPLPNARMTAAGELDINDSNALCYSKITATETTVGYVLHCNISSFTKSINLQKPIVIKDYKLESETDMYRLCSPNYSGVFEFNAAKNGGVTTVNVSCTYKPYTPYIKLYPSFSRLYGSDFNDARGLICGGDYSIAALNDAWETYQLQNKNYQASFDRQIENLEIHNKFGLMSDIAGAVGGTAGGIASGFALGGPVGAVVGGISSAVAGGADTFINNLLRQEDLKYTKDQFGYQLGNIQALPQGLSKTSAYNVDNKYFPFLEYYTCSNEEKAALQNKLKYNGMTVMAIGTIQQYINPDERTYIKGQIIRLENVDADYKVCSEIYNEINRGVFV